LMIPQTRGIEEQPGREGKGERAFIPKWGVFLLCATAELRRAEPTPGERAEGTEANNDRYPNCPKCNGGS
jgi:hypothetical protein